MKVPAIAVNSFFPRLKVQESDTTLTQYLQDLQIYPINITIDKDNSVSEVLQCPSNLHMVVWNPSINLNINIYHESSAAYFNPTYDNIRTQYPHNIIYSIPHSDHELPPHMSTTLTSNEYLFVPFNHMISIPNVISTDTITILKLCFVDASNFKLVQKSLFLQAKVSPAASTILSQLSAPYFNSTMDRDPKDLPYEVYQTFPRINLNNSPEDTKKDTPKIKKSRGGGFRGNS